MKNIAFFGVLVASVLGALGVWACNPFVSPTDANCAGMVSTVTNSAPVWVPIMSAVTPTGVVTGTIAFTTSGAPCILSATSWVKLIAPATSCGFSPPSPQ